MVSLDFLERVDLLHGLDDDQLTAIQHKCQEQELKSGDILFREGEDAAFLYIVADGRIDLRFDLPNEPTSAENSVASLESGSICGWSALVRPYKYTLTAYCAGRRCSVLKIRREDLRALFAEDALCGYRVMTNLAGIAGSRFYRLQEEAARHRGFNMMHNW